LGICWTLAYENCYSGNAGVDRSYSFRSIVMSKRDKLIKEILDDIYEVEPWVLEGIVERVLKKDLPNYTDEELKEFSLTNYMFEE
jgi:restriction endonuclease Mrr